MFNEKRDEINQIENENESKIIFNFENHYSLHEPSIDIINEKSKENNVKKNDKLKTNKKVRKKFQQKKTIKKNTKTKTTNKNIKEKI